MKVDMSPQAVTARLKLLNQLWELSIKLLPPATRAEDYGNGKFTGEMDMRQIEATIDTKGRIILHENIELDKSRRALVTILDEEPKIAISETALLSEKSLAEHWNTPEEDRAWQHLAELPSC